MNQGNCWMCNEPLDEDEVQYCSECELAMLQEMAAESAPIGEEEGY